MQIFELFRYQLLPSSQQQQDLFRTTFSAEEIRQKKNQFFDQVLASLPNFHHRGLQIRHKVEYHVGDFFVFKLGAHKSVDRDTEDFEKERIESWPNITVIIDNNPNTQIIAISKNIKAFSSTSSVANLLERTLTPPLRSFGLTIQIREQFEKHNFWSVIDQYEGKITRVRFEMISPNMANISHVLRVDLKQLNRDTNCQKINIGLEAVDGAALEITRENKLIDGCVEYASEGGGDIAIKIRGIKNEIRTSTSVKTKQIDEVFIEAPGSDLLGLLRDLLTK